MDIRKLRFGSKKIVSLVTAMCLAGTLAGCTHKNSDLSNEITEENRIGYSTFDSNVGEENFVILDVGNHDVQNKKAKKQIKKCNDNDISVGIVISTEARNEADIYDDVEYVRSLVNDYKIDFPIYLDLEQIINNEELNSDMKGKLMADFLEKCSANNMYVGIAGSDKTLSLANKYFSDVIKDYDVYVTDSVENSRNSSYPYTLSRGEDGKIYSTYDLSDVIEGKSLNTAEGLENDKKVAVFSEEELIETSLKSGISVADLLAYNDLKKENITEGTMLKVPNEQNIKTRSLEVTDNLVRGCDISWAQGENINWEKMKNNFDFIIIRSNYGKNIDKCFHQNIKNANLHGMRTGIYCFNNYTTSSIKDLETFKECQQEQLAITLDAIKDYEVTYPIYLDIEKTSANERNANWNTLLPEEYAISMVNIWHKNISDNGYIPGFYFNQECCDYFKSLYQKVSSKSTKTEEELNFLSCWDNSHKWIAGGTQYGSTYYCLDDVEQPSNKIMNKYPEATGFQVTSTAIGAGAGNDAGCLDVNWFYELKEVFDEEPVEIKEFDDNDNLLKGALCAGGAVTIIGMGSAIYYTYNKHKEAKKREKMLRMERNYRKR